MHSCTIVVHVTCYHPLWPLCNLHWEDLQGALGRVSDNVHLAILRKPFHSSASARAFSGVTGMGGKKGIIFCTIDRNHSSCPGDIRVDGVEGNAWRCSDLSQFISRFYTRWSLCLPLIEISISNNKKLLKAGLIIETWPKRVTLDSIMEWRKTWVQNLDSILRRGHICSSCYCCFCCCCCRLWCCCWHKRVRLKAKHVLLLFFVGVFDIVVYARVGWVEVKIWLLRRPHVFTLLRVPQSRSLMHCRIHWKNWIIFRWNWFNGNVCWKICNHFQNAGEPHLLQISFFLSFKYIKPYI